MQQGRFQWQTRPTAKKGTTVFGTHWRFTVLSDSLIRMEWAPDGIFEDRASQVAFFRDFGTADFTVSEVEGTLILDTDALTLIYQKDAPFAADTLSVTLKREPGGVWHYGETPQTLGGTARTLDEVDGRCHMGDGVCSMSGFAVIDDSGSLLLEEDGGIGLRRCGCSDIYLFAHGLNYLAAVGDLYRLTGAPPLLPAYALGNWWSRYYDYSQDEYLALMERFRAEGVPFSVGVVDMDWHIVDIPEDKRDSDPRFATGWTGYSWNRELFPDHKEFLDKLHAMNLKTALNLHPAQGVCRHEDMYRQYAEARGIDPDSGDRVPLDILSEDAMEAYFDILHHPYEEDGVDFWWMDWQQGTDYWWIHEANAPGEYRDPRERMDPLWMLNHLHILDISRNGKRPMFFSRYAGPGSHRYPVGFSGDTVVSWDSLDFQPEFTSTASNIGYCWWSHDIGGHMWGIRDDELFQRWVQLGVFSPINRLHSTKQRFMCKEPWNYPKHTGENLTRWLQLRHRLFPYLYSMNYRTHRELLPLVQPMYYRYPKSRDAYRYANQFFFGSELMAAPITQKADASIGLGKVDVWFPEGSWFDLFDGTRYDSLCGRTLRVYRDIEHMPVFAKAGAILPMADYDPADGSLCCSERMEVLVFPGATGAFTLTEDAGDGEASPAETGMALAWQENHAEFTIAAPVGNIAPLPCRRTWRIGFRGFNKNTKVNVSVNGIEVAAQSRFCSACNTIWVEVAADVSAGIAVTLEADGLMGENLDIEERIETLIRLANMRYDDKETLFAMATDKATTLRRKAAEMSDSFCPIAGAVLELLCLTEDPYTGSQRR